MARRKTRKTKKTKTQTQYQSQIQAIVLCTLGLLLFFLAFVRGTQGWLTAHNVLLGLFGWSSFFIGPLMVYIAVMISFDKLSDNTNTRIILTCALVFLISAAFLLLVQFEYRFSLYNPL